MGDDSIVYTCFELKDKWDNKICLYSEDKPKSRTLEINGKEFDLNKTTAKKIIKGLSEEFGISGGGKGE